ncbi:MAG: head-tail joining protein [Roseibium sp.]
MSIDLEADLAAFFSMDDFAVIATYTLQAGGAGTIVGIFDTPQNITELGEVGFVAAAPIFTVQTSTIPGGLSEGDTLTIKGVAYLVTHEPEDDATGVSVITLEVKTP